MAKDDKEFIHESLQDTESIINYLNALGEGFQHGKLLLTRDSEEFVLETPKLLKFDLRAKEKSDAGQIVIKISWKKQKKGKDLKVEPLVIESEPRQK